jgi:ethylbenzene dioxygenase alpha subunit
MTETIPDVIADASRGVIDRKIFWDRSIYELELERIFARSWVFLAHESQLPESGSFLTTNIGSDNVIVVRGRDKVIRAFLNSCPHRGNRVCHAEAGRTRGGFVCNYHGWSFGLDGTLRGMHESDAYRAEPNFDFTECGLVKVAQVDAYKGLVFGCLDADAPMLEEYLGDFRWYMDILLDNQDGGTEFIGGCIRSIIDCNWKIPAENFAGDALHAGWTHDSGARAMLDAPVPEWWGNESYQVNVNGHCWEFNLDLVGNVSTFGDKRLNRWIRSREAEVSERLGEMRSRMVGAFSSATVFPNMSFLPGQQTFRVWQPLSPTKTELKTWILVNKALPDELKEAYRKGAMMTFSPSGVFEMDDGENWEYSTRANEGVVTRRQKLHYGLGADSRIDHPVLPGDVHRNQLNDSNQRAYYRRWADLMAAATWSDVPES